MTREEAEKITGKPITRQDEIILESYNYNKYLLDTGIDPDDEIFLKAQRFAFIDGAKWADSHNEGLNMHIKFFKEELIDKACEWWHKQIRKETTVNFTNMRLPRTDEFIDIFREYMEQ